MPEPAMNASDDSKPWGQDPKRRNLNRPAHKRRKPDRTAMLCAAVILTGAAAGTIVHLGNGREQDRIKAERIGTLERQGKAFVENRRWQEAARAFAEIDAIAPGAEQAKLGRASITAGMAEEQSQYVGYWIGQSIAELEAGRFDEAEVAANKVLERFPADSEAAALLERVNKTRANRSREEILATARKHLADRKWDEARVAAKRLTAGHPDDADALEILREAEAAIAKARTDREKARALVAQVIEGDTGQFNQPLLDTLREAAALDPENREIAGLLEKMSSYTRTLRVPGDYPTPEEALEASRPNDRVVLSDSTWQGPILIKHPVDLQGAGADKTVIACPADAGCAITIAPGVAKARISGITFRHGSILMEGGERFSVALVSNSTADFFDCRFLEASGHGLAVIDGGRATARRCRFADNGWNGAAAMGRGSFLDIRESEASNNFENGIEIWNHAGGRLADNHCEANSRNGIHADCGESAATITGNRLIANREFGAVFTSASAAVITGNTARENLLGGYVLRAAVHSPAFTGNTATRHTGPGLVTEKGVPATAFPSNSFSGNQPDIQADADLQEQPPQPGEE